MSDWFEDWFDSKEYLTVYAHRNQVEAEKFINHILEKTGVAPGNSILDLACGAGRHSIAFAKRGYSVTAIDLSENLLRVGIREAKKQNLEINFLRRDIREIDIEAVFDLVVNIFTSFGYFENDADNFGIFETAYEHTHKDGFFVFDFLNEHFVRKNIIPFSQEIKEDYTIKQYRSIEDGVVVKKIVIEKADNSKTFFEKVKLFDAQILQNEIKKTGFAITELMGNYDGAPFNAETSSRFIAICKK